MESFFFSLKEGKEDNSMKWEVSLDLTRESGPEHGSGISAIRPSGVGWGGFDTCDDATKAFLSHQVPPETPLGL